MDKVVFVGDIADPKTGKTWSEENLEKQHKIPLDTLVEVMGWEDGEHNGIRAFVCEHQRDCDETPLYGLSMTKGYRREKYGKELERLAAMAIQGGFSEESLKIVGV